MTTYGVREFKAKVSEILRGLEDGEEVIITRRGKPCGRLIPMRPTAQESALKRLRELPEAVCPTLNGKTSSKPRRSGNRVSRMTYDGDSPR